MSSHSYIIGNDFINLTNFKTGNSITVFRSDQNYDQFKKLIAVGKYAEAETLVDVKVHINTFAKKLTATNIPFNIFIDNGIIEFSYDGERQPLVNAIVDKIISFNQDNLPVQPLVNFVANLMQNPSKQSVDELYMFLEQSKLPITEDGCFIAYKIVRNDYMDIYTGKFDNSIGKTVSMQRNQVDDQRNNTCSQGLHFCSKGYLTSYSSHNRDTDRCVLVKINPADVVSIPSDYNNAKGRTWKYVVVGEVTDDSWRQNLSQNDFTSQPVVSSTATPFVRQTAKVARSMKDVFDEYFYVNQRHTAIYWNDSDREANYDHVINKLYKFAYPTPSDADLDNFYNDLVSQSFSTFSTSPVWNEYSYNTRTGWTNRHWPFEQHISRSSIMDTFGFCLQEQELIDLEDWAIENL